jgi:hypothetical protein
VSEIVFVRQSALNTCTDLFYLFCTAFLGLFPAVPGCSRPFWGCSRLFPAVPGCFGAVPGCSRPVPGLFPAFFGLFRLSPCHSYNFMLLQEFLSALLNFSKFFKKFPQREVSSHTL